jgi:hypothetical protein
MAFVMRNLNSEPARRDVYLWSPAPVSVPPGYHKVLEPVKGIKVLAPTCEFRGMSAAG